jgi:hypothetical protein
MNDIRDSILPDSLKNCEIKIYIKAHKTKVYATVFILTVLYGCES